MNKESNFKWKLGMFVTLGLILFVITIYFVGKQKNLFGSTFHLKSHFKTVSGLKEGNNVRFSGINIGTVYSIGLINDTTIIVDIVLDQKYKQFIKSDAQTSISSDGLMGDKILVILPGKSSQIPISDNDMLLSIVPLEMEDIMVSMKKSLDNVGLISDELAQFSHKVNNGNGVLSKMISDEEFSGSINNTLVNLQRSSDEFSKFTSNMNSGKGTLAKLMTDEKFGRTLDSIMVNIKSSTKGLSENMEAAKSSVFLKGYFKKKQKAEDLKLTNELKQEKMKIITDSLNRLKTPNGTLK